MVRQWAAVILAAGQSRRFGDRDKLAHIWNGKPILRHAADNAIAAGLSPVILVHRPNQALPDLPPGMTPVPCPDASCGMGHSLRTGLAAVPEDCAGAAILLGDMPNIKPDTFQTLIDQATSQTALRPAYQGQPGHPVFIPRSLFGQAANLQGEEGLKVVLGAQIKLLALDDPGCIWDIDSPSDLT